MSCCSQQLGVRVLLLDRPEHGRRGEQRDRPCARRSRARTPRRPGCRRACPRRGSWSRRAAAARRRYPKEQDGKLWQQPTDKGQDIRGKDTKHQTRSGINALALDDLSETAERDHNSESDSSSQYRTISSHTFNMITLASAKSKRPEGHMMFLSCTQSTKVSVTCEVQIENVRMTALIDTGSPISGINMESLARLPAESLEGKLKKCNVAAGVAMTDQTFALTRAVSLTAQFDEKSSFSHCYVIMPHIATDLLFGLDILADVLQAQVMLPEAMLKSKRLKIKIPLRYYQQIPLQEEKKRVSRTDNTSWSITKQVTVPPSSMAYIEVRNQSPDEDVVQWWDQPPTRERKKTAVSIMESQTVSTLEGQKLYVPRTVLDAQARTQTIAVMNLQSRNFQLKKGYILAQSEVYDEKEELLPDERFPQEETSRDMIMSTAINEQAVRPGDGISKIPEPDAR